MPREDAPASRYVTLPIKTQTLLKDFVLLFFITNWTSCTLTLLTAYTLGACCKMAQFAMCHECCHGLIAPWAEGATAR